MNLRDQRGFTLPELLIAMIVFAFVLLATFAVFDRYYRLSGTNNKQNDAVEESRVTIDQVTRQLRNLASPTSPQSTINTAQPYNLIFQTDDPTKTWVRYCLVTNGSGASAKGTLYYATSSASTLSSAQTTDTCPGTNWASVQQIATDITNTTNALDRPIFTYTCTAGSPSACPSSASDNSKIVLADIDLDVDTNPGQAPAERRVASGVFLRNQNQPPTGSFTATPIPGQRTVILNASASSDPEGRTLHYDWCKGSFAGDCTSQLSNYIGTGVTLNYVFPLTDVGTQTISLTVRDPGGLTNTPPFTQTMPIP